MMWVALDEEATQDYLNGYFVPLRVRETEHGVEAWNPHRLSHGAFTGATVCQDCGLMPMDYDAFEFECNRESA